MPQRLLLLLSFFTLTFFLSGCGVGTDLVRDNEIRLGFIGRPDYLTPLKLKVGIIPFKDEVGLGTQEAGPNLARLISEQFAQDEHLLVIPAATVKAAVDAHGWSSPLTTEQAKELGQELNANVIIDGSIDQITQFQLRQGWRRVIRLFTNQQQYVEAMLSLNLYDTATGIVLASRASNSRYQVGPEEKDPFNTTPNTPPSQESLEQTLDLAIEEAYYRTIDGLAATPFKARIKSVEGNTATIDFGQDVDISTGMDFVFLSTHSTITNSIDVSYDIPGAPQARLKVKEVSPNRTQLEIVDGQVYVGDYIQFWDN